MSTFRVSLLAACVLTHAAPTVAAAQDGEEEAVRALIQAQADAFNRGDLDGTMATLSRDVDWRTIQRVMITGHEPVSDAMRGWIDALHGDNVRLVYPPDSVNVQVLSPDHAVADVILIWEDATPGPGPRRRSSVENLFFVVERVNGRWAIRHVRNTTTSPPSPGG